MNLLLTNDDGYQSRGLKELAAALSKKHKVFLVAPDANRSAVSHHYTLFNENKIRLYDKNKWTCSGYPADCVFAGLSGALFEEKIDAVLAGINYGPNLGSDIIYSGTCAAARQAMLQNIPALALSIDPLSWNNISDEHFQFSALATFVTDNLEKLLELVKMDYPRAFVNINALSLDSYKGVKLTNQLCNKQIRDKLTLIPQGENEMKTLLTYGNNETSMNAGEDFKECKDGYISISRIYADPICCPIVDGIDFSL